MALYPQFASVSPEILDFYTELAERAIREARWREYTAGARALLAAHFITLWQRSAGAAGETVAENAENAPVKQKTVDGVSIQYDTASESAAFPGGGSLARTPFGQQLLTLLPLTRHGGFTVQ